MSATVQSRVGIRADFGGHHFDPKNSVWINLPIWTMGLLRLWHKHRY